MKVKKLQESMLIEAFSPSMPDWLKKSLVVDTWYDTGNYNVRKSRDAIGRYNQTASRRVREKDPNMGSKSFYGRNKEYRSLFAGLSAYDLDLSKAKFIHGDVPKKSTDPRLSDPFIGFLYIEYGGHNQVYAPGVNDLQVSIIPDRNGNGNTFKYVSKPEILKYTTDFCYVNTKDPDNLITDTRNKRNDPANKEDKNFKRYKEKKKSSYFDPKYTDKSGYIIDPEKYKKKLKELGVSGDKIQAKLINYADQLKSLHRDAVNAFQDFDILNDSEAIATQRTILNKVSNAIDTYNTMVNAVNSFPAQEKLSGSDYYVSKFFDREATLKQELKEIESLISNYILQEVDWETPE